MTDIFTPAKRSEMMSRIRGKGNKGTELAFARLLREHGITGWRRHLPLLGKPDFVFRRERVIVFVDGCYWHGCRWHYREPTTNVEFWQRKIEGNRQRDRKTTAILRRQGWKVLRVWEHSLAQPEKIMLKLAKALA